MIIGLFLSREPILSRQPPPIYLFKGTHSAAAMFLFPMDMVSFVGMYRLLTSINTASNHLPVLVVIAQHGSSHLRILFDRIPIILSPRLDQRFLCSSTTHSGKSVHRLANSTSTNKIPSKSQCRIESYIFKTQWPQ